MAGSIIWLDKNIIWLDKNWKRTQKRKICRNAEWSNFSAIWLEEFFNYGPNVKSVHTTQSVPDWALPVETKTTVKHRTRQPDCSQWWQDEFWIEHIFACGTTFLHGVWTCFITAGKSKACVEPMIWVHHSHRSAHCTRGSDAKSASPIWRKSDWNVYGLRVLLWTAR